MTSPLLVVAGEASGDRAAAAVVTALAHERPIEPFGMGGGACESGGVELLCDMRRTTALGIGAVAVQLPRVMWAFGRILRETRKRGATCALLVGYSEFNTRLARILHRHGVRVLFYGAPQIWAWRPERAPRIAASVDMMAVVLPFEEGLWRSHGVDARYVGHPALEVSPLSRADAREALGLTELAKAIAILPGSRPHEVRHLLEPMLEAAETVRRDRASIDSRVLLAGSLDTTMRAYVRSLASRAGVPVYDVSPSEGAAKVLPAFDVALAASGTATLEAALAHAIPVTAYRVGLASELVARALVKTPYYALPNVILERAAFTELVQDDVRPRAIASAITRALDQRPRLVEACEEVRAKLGSATCPSREVAAMLVRWMSWAPTDGAAATG